MRLGASFSPRRAAQVGLDPHAALQQLLGLGLAPIRLSAYWDQVDQDGYAELDWQLDEAARAARPVLLSVGMKAQGWPEFYIAARLVPQTRRCADVTWGNPGLREAALEFVRRTVERYRAHPALIAWQVENEPLNRSGPNRWWIGPDFLGEEIAALRALEVAKPVFLTAFGHFNLILDILSNPWGQGADRLLGLLAAGDGFGLDVYIRIGYRVLGFERVAKAAGDWPAVAVGLRARAEANGRQAWITEAQAEPWEASPATYLHPLSFAPGDIATVVAAVREAGFDTVLLWGSEYWLARAAAGDRSWLDAVLALPT